MAPLQEQIQAINQRLRAYGIEAVQEIRMTDRDGKTIGQVKYGYRPQYVFEALRRFKWISEDAVWALPAGR